MALSSAVISPGSIGVIFDCDGTLLDTMQGWHELEDYLALSAHTALTLEQRSNLTALSIKECAVYFHERFGLGASGQVVETMIDDFMYAYYKERVRTRPGVHVFVEGLARQGAHLSVASLSPTNFLQAGLQGCDLLPYFDIVVSTDEVGGSKRTPAVWNHARSAMGTTLARTWGVEDSLYALRTLVAAGYKTLGIYDCDIAGSPEELREVADHFITSFEDIDVQTFAKWNMPL